MTRDERERELLELSRADFKQLHALYKQTKGIPSGATLPAATLTGAMIQAILAAEFPPQSDK